MKDLIDRQVAIKALCREECGMDPKGCHVGTCYDVEIIEDVPSVQLKLSNNSPELENKNGELISRQEAIDIVHRYNKSHMILKGKPMIGWASIVIELEDLPSAQPETNCSEIPNNSDLISRQAAIDAEGDKWN